MDAPPLVDESPPLEARGRAALPDGPRPPEGSAMLRRFGPLYWLSGLGVLLFGVRLEEHSAENIRRANASGPLVYALYNRSLIDWLALNIMLNQRRLPLAALSVGIRSTWLRPLLSGISEAWRALGRLTSGRSAPDPVASGALAQLVARGGTACVFLTARQPLREALGAGMPDVVEALLAAQERCDRPVQIVPVAVIWRREPEAARGEVARFLLGNQDEPGPFGKLWSVINRSGGGLVQAGEALDLRKLQARIEGKDRPTAVRTARMVLRRYLYREGQVVRGPRIRPHRAIRRIVLGSAEVKRLVAEEAAATQRPEAAVRASVARTLDRLAARMQASWMQIGDVSCRFLFNRIYDGVDIGEEDLDKLRAAMRAGTPVLVPNHRSHLDYLLLSWVFYRHDLAPPHIVAGDNLSFFPLGPVLRRMGAFFIKRSFKGDRVFPVVFERYLRQLIRDGFPIEFFIEGGRSRTGKMLPPKLGVLGMVMDAAASVRAEHAVTFVPVSIAYEQIAEEKVYQRELSGQPKQKEDLGQLVRATRVLGRRYGRVYLRIGDAFTTDDALGSASGKWKELDREHRQEILQRTGERLVHRIAETTVVLPTSLVAMALLAQTTRGIRVSALHARVGRLRDLVEGAGARTATSLSHAGWAVEQALARFEAARMVTRVPNDEGDILQVAFEQRITLEYYKNALLHFVTPASLMAAAVRGLSVAGEPLDPDRLRALFQLQVFLLRYEVTLDPEVPLEALETQAIDSLVAYGALERDAAGALTVAARGRVTELAEVTRNFLESYLMVLQGAQALRSRDIPTAELAGRIQEWGKVRLAIDEIERHEALSLSNLSNAVKAFREEGALELRAAGGGLQFNEAAVTHYVASLRLLLARRAE